jgi:hypothetical protein
VKLKAGLEDDHPHLPISSRRHLHSAIARRTAVLSLIIVLLFAALGYVSLSRTISNGHTTSTRTVTETTDRTYSYTTIKTIVSHESSISTFTKTVILASPCAQTPPETKQSEKIFRNGTLVSNSSYPVLALQPGSTGTLCVNYSDPYGSTVSSFPISVFDWNNWSSHPNGFSFSEYPSNITLRPGHNGTIVYTLTASNSTAGYYVLAGGNGCFRYPLAVSNNPSAITFSDFPGFLSPVFGCRTQGVIQTLLGFNGFTAAYLHRRSRVNLGYNITSQSVTSVIESPNKQNITFTTGIQSFSFPITVWFATGPGTFSTIREFNFNPQVTPIPGDTCDWNISNQSVYSNGNWREFPLPAQGFTINAPPLHLQPYSQGTFRFSMLVSNLTAGYYVTFLGFVISWQNSPGINTALDLGTYFPISVGSGQWNQNISGTCPRGPIYT